MTILSGDVSVNDGNRQPGIPHGAWPGNDGSAVLTSCFLPSSKSEGLENFTQGGDVTAISAGVYAMKSIWRES